MSRISLRSSALQSLVRAIFALVNLPVTVWNRYQLIERKFSDTQHLLRLDAYLLEDMGLKRVGDRIEAIDQSRIESDAPHLAANKETESTATKHIRPAN